MYKIFSDNNEAYIYYFNDIYNVFDNSPKNELKEKHFNYIRDNVNYILNYFIDKNEVYNYELRNLCKKEIVIFCTYNTNNIQLIKDIDLLIKDIHYIRRYYEGVDKSDIETINRVNRMIEVDAQKQNIHLPVWQ